MKELSKSYDPKGVENKWYQFWLEKGYFHADENSLKPPFCIVIPPPNITGSLHLGHALNITLQDILIRYKRMDSYNALWLPGTDHAGIATQNVVERQLVAEGTDRHSIGRDAFIKRVWQWREEYGGIIINQLKRMGASCDWQRERFTMDEGLSKAVREVFVRLYEEGLIYRGDYIINWCPRCRTALSDLEVEHEEVRGRLYYIKYPLEKGNPIIVATTRPETMLGDTAVAIHPEDSRYKGISGKKALLPIMERWIPIIEDSYVDPEFGTGAVKVTPAHDPNDFEMGLRHNLPRIKVMDEDGRMSAEAGKYFGQERFECRESLLRDLKKEGYLEKTEDYTHSVGHCYRCGTIVEPYLSKQWFVKMKDLARPAIRAVEDGKIRLIPKGWENSYFDWMSKIKDWCISRQIWWGHRIPAWHCEEMRNAKCKMQNGIIVSRDVPEKCPYCGSEKLTQEGDVLDTWFSSALWPFSTLGWPEDTKELKVFYPTTVLVTSFDIIFFWVARMIIMGLKFMEDIPFRDVYIHALVRDAEGQKMSKSKGNIIDPLLMVDKYGTDAFRFTLAAFAAQGRDIRFSEERVEGYRHFCNKIWNASRFVLMNLTPDFRPQTPDLRPQTLPDRWILSRLNHVIRGVRGALEEYRFNEAANYIYQFIWHEFCDWYIEMIKPTLSIKGKEGKETLISLIHTLDISLRLLHPFMPFITEEIWQNLPHDDKESITVSEFPKEDPGYSSPQAEEEMSLVMAVVMGIRNIRGEMNISPSLELKATVRVQDDKVKEILERNLLYIERLAKGKEIKIGRDLEKPKMAATAISEGIEIYVPLEGILDIDGERSRLMKDLEKVEREIVILSKKLTNEDFLTKAPRDVVNKDRTNYNLLTEKAKKIKEGIEKLKLIKEEAAL